MFRFGSFGQPLFRKEKEMVFGKEVKCSWVGREYNVSPNVVYGVLAKIESEKGSVTRMDFLEASRPDNAPTHKMFQWDDEKAAELYRLDQSGRIINALKVEVITSDDGKKKKTAPAFVRVESTRSFDRYNNIGLALSVPDKREFVLNQAYCDMRIFKRKYETLKELSGVIGAIDAVLPEGVN